MSAAAAVTSAVASKARATTWLFRNHVLKRSPGENRKNPVVEGEKAEVAAGIVDDARADAADDDGNREGQEEQRQQQLARAADRRHRGEQRSDGCDPEIGENDAAGRRA